MALLNIVCLLNTHYVQLTVLSSVGETKSIKTRLLLSRSLSSVWIDRWHTRGHCFGLLQAAGLPCYENAEVADIFFDGRTGKV